MTLPTGALAMSQIATELGRSLPLGLQDSWVRQLAQVTGAACDFDSLRGKTGRFDGSVLCQSGASGLFLDMGGAPWFGGQLSGVFGNTHPSASTGIGFSTPPNWSGNILLKNNTTGVSVVLPKEDSLDWGIPGSVSNLLRAGQTDNFTILPSN